MKPVFHFIVDYQGLKPRAFEMRVNCIRLVQRLHLEQGLEGVDDGEREAVGNALRRFESPHRARARRTETPRCSGTGCI